MSQSILQMEKDFLDYNKKISAYNEALALNLLGFTNGST